MKILVISVLISFAYLSSSAQKLLFHKNRHQEAFYEIGDEIAFRLKGKDKISGRIIDLDDSLIIFQNYQAKLADISHLCVDDKPKLGIS